MTTTHTQRKKESAQDTPASGARVRTKVDWPSPSSKSLDKRFFLQDFVSSDTSLSVFLDLNLPCRHDITALCKQ